MAHPTPPPDPTPRLEHLDLMPPVGADRLGQRPDPPERWPGTVGPPTSPGFLQSAKTWLFEFAPPRWRHEETLHRHPVELAHVVSLHLQADIIAMQAGLSEVAQSVLAEPARANPSEITDFYACERDWACAMLEQVKLVEQALRAVCDSASRRLPTAGTGRARSRAPMPRQRPATA
ncbi:hypothetical protein [Streptomyces sp. 8N706]|uniref:hypothetical protein n=1 Tax=Streptomyces sp. 8N706 TaxID=3457416 RepID=UPI003FD25246